MHRKNYSKMGNDADGEQHAGRRPVIDGEAGTATASRTNTRRDSIATLRQDIVFLAPLQMMRTSKPHWIRLISEEERKSKGPVTALAEPLTRPQVTTSPPPVLIITGDGNWTDDHK